MKRILLASAAALLLSAPPIHAQADGDPMQRMMAAATPGAAHKFLDTFVGTWDLTTRVWMEPGAPPAESNGTAEVRWILEGRYLEDVTTGSMMGMPLHGRGISGYDNMKKKYVAIWIDNMSTAISTMEGSLDETGRVLTYHGRIDDPMTGETGKPVKYVLRVEGPDTHVFEMHDPQAAGQTRIMEITYRRKK